MPEVSIGKVTHYFGKISVAIIKLTEPLKVGQTVHFKGAHTDFTQAVDSMQIEHVNVEEAKVGDDVGLKALEKVHEGDQVFLVT
jgi:putative protease